MTAVTAVDNWMRGAIADDRAAMSITDRVSATLAERYIWAADERAAITAAANDPQVASDPERLYALQWRQEAYVKQIALSSALLSQATKGIETLVKS